MSRVNKSNNRRIKNAKFSGYCFYMNPNIRGNFQICISVPLIIFSCYFYLLTISKHTLIL